MSLSKRVFPYDALREDTVVIKTEYLGICRADAKEIRGSRDVPQDRGPLFGHELVGTVCYAGSRTRFRDGETVTFNPNITPTRTTGFAEYVFVHGSEEQLEQAVVRVPEAGMGQGAWMPEPFACIVHAVKKLLELAGPASLRGKRTGIVGAGCAGLMFAMYARHLGAQVTVFNRGEQRRSFAREQEILAAHETHALADADSFRDEFDVVVVAPTIATTQILETAVSLTADGGHLLVYGGTRKGDIFPMRPGGHRHDPQAGTDRARVVRDQEVPPDGCLRLLQGGLRGRIPSACRAPGSVSPGTARLAVHRPP